MVINEKEIIARGYVTNEEYDELGKWQMTKIRCTSKANDHTNENFWAVRLKENPDKIIIFNDLVNWWGNITAGLVGQLKNGCLDLDWCNENFRINGPKFMEYMQSIKNDEKGE